MLTMSECMTKMPHTIELRQTVASAREKMGKLKIRHLPVLSGGELVGLVSERDLDYLAKLVGSKCETCPVEDVMVDELYLVHPETAVDKAAGEMADRNIGSALVTDKTGSLVGIFTTTDALRLISRLTH